MAAAGASYICAMTNLLDIDQHIPGFAEWLNRSREGVPEDLLAEFKHVYHQKGLRALYTATIRKRLIRGTPWPVTYVEPVLLEALVNTEAAPFWNHSQSRVPEGNMFIFLLSSPVEECRILELHRNPDATWVSQLLREDGDTLFRAQAMTNRPAGDFYNLMPPTTSAHSSELGVTEYSPAAYQGLQLALKLAHVLYEFPHLRVPPEQIGDRTWTATRLGRA